MNRMVQTCESCFRVLNRFVNISTKQSEETHLLCSVCYSKNTNLVKRVLRALGIKRRRRPFGRSMSWSHSNSSEDYQIFINSEAHGWAETSGENVFDDSRGRRSKHAASSRSVRYMSKSQSASTPKQVRPTVSSRQDQAIGFRLSDQKTQKRKTVLPGCQVSEKLGILRRTESTGSSGCQGSNASGGGLPGINVQEGFQKVERLAKRSVHWADADDGPGLETVHLLKEGRPFFFNLTACIRPCG